MDTYKPEISTLNRYQVEQLGLLDEEAVDLESTADLVEHYKYITPDGRAQ